MFSYFLQFTKPYAVQLMVLNVCAQGFQYRLVELLILDWSVNILPLCL